MSTPSTNHQLELSTRDFDGDFVVTEAEAPNLSVRRFERDDRYGTGSRHHTTIALHRVTDFKVDMNDPFGPGITLKVNGENVRINIFPAKDES